jgi:hypothetical protein
MPDKRDCEWSCGLLSDYLDSRQVTGQQVTASPLPRPTNHDNRKTVSFRLLPPDKKSALAENVFGMPRWRDGTRDGAVGAAVADAGAAVPRSLVK